MKKRLFIGLVVGTMCVGLVGCGGNSSNIVMSIDLPRVLLLL